jgi:hypothetical protein
MYYSLSFLSPFSKKFREKQAGRLLNIFLNLQNKNVVGLFSMKYPAGQA